jgi:hypothetical protein
MKRFVNKLTRKQALAFGAGLLVIVGILGLLLGVRPSMLGYQEQMKAYETAQAEAKSWPDVDQAYKAEVQRMIRVRSQWNDCYRRMPNISLKSPERALVSIWIEYGEQLGQRISRWVVGRTLRYPQGVSIPEPQVTPPEPTTSLIAVPLDGFGVSAMGFSGVLGFLRGMREMPRLVSIKSLKVEGQSGGLGAGLSVSIPATIYLFTRDYTQGPPAAATASATGVAGQAGTTMPGEAGPPPAGGGPAREGGPRGGRLDEGG